MKDNLARKIYAQKIADEISEHYDSELKDFNSGAKKDRENIVFAISAKWGEGKTTLLGLLEKPLCNKGFRIITFNPWKYSQEDITLKRAFLGSVKEQLESMVDLDDLYFDRARTSLKFDKLLFIKMLLWGLFFFFALLPAIFGFTLFDWLTKINNISSFLLNISLFKTLITLLLIPIVLQLVTVSRKSANISTAEEFEKMFKKLLKNQTKIVIFIDDLDRCSPKTVKVVLDSLRTFFQHPECSYIITGDHTVVERYAGNELELPDDEDPQQKLKEGRRFLKKLFDVYWRLPLPTPYQFGLFVDDEIKSSKIELNELQTLNLKSFLIDNDLFERNPRHVKRFLTKLRFALEGVNLQKKEVEDQEDTILQDSKEALNDILINPDLLAKVLLFEEYFYPIYEKLILHPDELINHEKALRSEALLTPLKIDKEIVLNLFNKKQEDLDRYIALVKRIPQFTDDDNSTLHEVSSYFSFSGSTGLPSVMGPDESNFGIYLKSGQLDNKLGPILAVSKKEKRESFVEKALEIMSTAVDTERSNIVGEALKLSSKFDEWADKLDQWKSNLFTLPPDKQKLLAHDFWFALLIKNPLLIAPTQKENPPYFEYLWDSFVSMKSASFHKDTKKELENILINFTKKESLNLRGIEIFLNEVGSNILSEEIIKQLDSPATCRQYLDHLVAVGFPEGQVATLVKTQLKVFLGNFSNFDWIIANPDYLKTQELFDFTKLNLKKWVKDVKSITRIADNRNVFELNDKDKNGLVDEILNLIKKSAGLDFLTNTNVQSLFSKDNKKEIFKVLKDILVGSNESSEKRNFSAELLVKSQGIWSDISSDDIYDILKQIKRTKNIKTDELKEKQKNILNSWGYSDSSEDTMEL